MASYFSIHLPVHTTLGGFSSPAKGGNFKSALTGLALLSRNRILSLPVRGYVEAFRCTPLLVQIIWMYYALPVVLKIDIPATVAAGLALTCYISSFYAEIFRGGVISIERGQWDAARALGMTRFQLMRRIILPQATKG
jgi:polar amino acid transport system permease protein